MGVLTALLTIRIGLLLAVQEAPAPAEPQRDLVLFLAPIAPVLAPAERSAVDVHALLDAVATYTRDLRIRVRLVRTDELAGPGARDAAVTLVRVRAARLAFWCAPGVDAGSLVLYIVDSQGTMLRDVVAGATRGAAELHRAVALKVRAVLAAENAAATDRGAARPGERAGQREQAAAAVPSAAAATPGSTAPPAGIPPVAPSRAIAATPTPAGPPAEKAAPNVAPAAPVPVPVDAAAAAATLRAAPPAGSAVAAPAFRWVGAFASAGYGLAYTSGNAPLRQGLALHGTAGLAWPVELDAGVEWAPRGQQTVATGSLTLRDIPMRLGARFVRRGPRLLAGVGAFGAVHVLSASASSPAGRQDWTTAAGGFGIEAVGRGPLGGGLSWEVRLWAERLVPRTRFLVGGEPALDTGAVTLGLGAGVAFPTR